MINQAYSNHQNNFIQPPVNNNQPSKIIPPFDNPLNHLPPYVGQDPLLLPKDRFLIIKPENSDPLLEELNLVLQLDDEFIEQNLNHLQNGQNHEWIKSLLKKRNSKNDKIDPIFKEALDFLWDVIPIEIQDNLETFGASKKISDLLTLADRFLQALENNQPNLALIYKSQILKHSKALLQEADNHLSELYENSPQPVPANNIDHEHIAENDRQQLKLQLDLWKMNITLQESYVDAEKVKLGISTASSFVSAMHLPLNYLPAKLIPSQAVLETSKQVLIGVSWVFNALGVILSAVDLYQKNKKIQRINQWMGDHWHWKKKHIPSYEGGAISMGKYTSNSPDRFNRGERKRNHHATTFKTPVLPLTEEQYKAQTLQMKEQLDQLIARSNFKQIKTSLNNIRIDLPAEIRNKKEFLIHLKTNEDLQERILSAYADFRRKSESLDHIIQTTEDLLEKREAIRDKKIHELRPKFDTVQDSIVKLEQNSFNRSMVQISNELDKDVRHLLNPDQKGIRSYEFIEAELNKWIFSNPQLKEKHQNLFNALNEVKQANILVASIEENPEHFHEGWKNNNAILEVHNKFRDQLQNVLINPQAQQEIFEAWSNSRTPDDRMEFYVDHQNTLEQTTKNALIEMIDSKHALEKKFTQFKFNYAAISYASITLSLAVTAAIALAGFAAITIPGAGWILLGLTIGTTLLSIGLMTASYHLAFSKKSAATFSSFSSLPIKLINAMIRQAIRNYRNRSKEKKLINIAKILHQLHTSKDQRNVKQYNKALNRYEKIKMDLEYSQKRLHHWENRLETCNARYIQDGWEDFVKQSPLEVSGIKDSLERFDAAFQQCDISLLSPEIKHLFKIQLSIDLDKLHYERQKNPDLFKNELQKFFALSDAEFISFIKRQSTLIAEGFIGNEK